MKDPTLYIFIRGTLFIEILNLIITSTLTIKLCKKIINRYFLFFHNKVVIFLIVKIIKFFWTSLFGSITKWSSNKKAGALLSYVNSVQNCIDNIDNIQHSPVQRIKFQSPFFLFRIIKIYTNFAILLFLYVWWKLSRNASWIHSFPFPWP